MKDECLICKAPLEYLESDELMECAICHRKENSKTRCVNGHYVCNECHMAGMDAIIGLCLRETSKNPVEVIEKMMALPFCHMHGPEHHVMVGAALLTAYKNAGGDIDLAAALTEMMNRGKSVPGGACGFWGACGAGISSGMFVSIISKSTPLAQEPFALSHKMTAKSLAAIGEIGGPRCCKRDSYLSILSAIDFVKEHFGVEMEKPEIVCTHSAQNNQCIGKRCPFAKANHWEVNMLNFQWTREPKNYKITEQQITITTEPHTDLWQRTYYHFRNDNAPVLQTETEEKYFSFVVKTDFSGSHHRFDQCGIVMYLDSENWLKGSVEYENESFQHLGSVVTNHGYSDWATTEIPAAVKTMWYRLSRREDDYCIECSQDGEHFSQMRVCHMWEGAGKIRFGIYACSPEDSSFTAVFTDIIITECAWKAHDGQKPDEEQL